MDKLFSVCLEYEMVVIADDENKAIYVAKQNLNNEDPLNEMVSPIHCRQQIPSGWDNSYPYMSTCVFCTDNTDLEGTCDEIFKRIEEREAEEERKRKIAEELDRKQLKFFFDENY